MGTSREGTQRRASRTAYFLNRALGYFALIRHNIRFPETPGIWILVSELDRPPWEVKDLLATLYPGDATDRLGFIALMGQDDVEDFENELRERGVLQERAIG
jgi:hypothetical protein